MKNLVLFLLCIFVSSNVFARLRNDIFDDNAYYYCAGVLSQKLPKNQENIPYDELINCLSMADLNTLCPKADPLAKVNLESKTQKDYDCMTSQFSLSVFKYKNNLTADEKLAVKNCKALKTDNQDKKHLYSDCLQPIYTALVERIKKQNKKTTCRFEKLSDKSTGIDGVLWIDCDQKNSNDEKSEGANI